MLPLWTSSYKWFVWEPNSVLSGIYLGLKLLDHTVGLCLTFWSIITTVFHSSWTILHFHHWASQVVLVVKNPPANAGDITDRFDPWVRKIPGRGHGNPLQFLPRESPQTKEPGRLQSIGLQRVRHDWGYKGTCTIIYKVSLSSPMFLSGNEMVAHYGFDLHFTKK